MSNTDSSTNNAAFDLKQWLPTIKSYAWTLIKCLPLTVSAAVLLGLFMRNRKLDSPTQYTANYSFTINRESSQKQQNIASLFGGPSVGMDDNVNFKRLQELVLTRQVLARVLFDSIELRYEKPEEPDLVINHYLDLYAYKNRTPEQAANNYYFQTDTIDPYDRKANRLIRRAQNAILKQLVLEPSPAGIMHMKVTSESEDFSYELIHALYRALDDYYNEEAIMQTERFYKMAQDRASQLFGQLRQAEAAYITYANTHAAEAGGRNNTLIETQFLSTDLKQATQSYFTSLANMEAARVAFDQQRETPSIIAVDPPLYPLYKVTPNAFLHLIAGAVVGFGLACFAVIGVRALLDYRKSQRATLPINQETNDNL